MQRVSSTSFSINDDICSTGCSAKVLVIGAGVVGLQVITTAKRLGSVVFAFDVRSSTKEQVESLGANLLM